MKVTEKLSICLDGEVCTGYREFNKKPPFYQTVHYNGKSSFDGFGYRKEQVHGYMLKVAEQMLYQLVTGRAL